MDFSENGAIENFDKSQSEHWQTSQYTLFMSICYFLSVYEWNKLDGKLSKFDEVTVDGEFYIIFQPRLSIDKESFCSIVTSRLGNNMYIVEGNDGNVSDLDRSQLYHLKRHVVSCDHVPDDKNNDRFVMQHLSTAYIEWLEGYMKDEFSNDIP